MQGCMFKQAPCSLTATRDWGLQHCHGWQNLLVSHLTIDLALPLTGQCLCCSVQQVLLHAKFLNIQGAHLITLQQPKGLMSGDPCDSLLEGQSMWVLPLHPVLAMAV